MNSIRRNPASWDRLRRARLLSALIACALTLAGCQAFVPAVYTPPQVGFGPLPPQSNPMAVNVMDRDLVWDQVVDVVDDYFRIDREERVKLVGDLLTEGRLDTYPRGGSTLLEPWNHDSVNIYERLESTLQSIRRRAMVRVTPTPAGFEIEVQVFKELEDVPRPETGSVSQANPGMLRNDDSLQRVTNPIPGLQPTLGWIGIGRDPALEQVMLAEIQAR
ncbi:MAG TPA: hypothetical protein VHV08_08350, partial [Pirellulales bacterium]|nr:hypothetical protein [Pirellulales bacterium]